MIFIPGHNAKRGQYNRDDGTGLLGLGQRDIYFAASSAPQPSRRDSGSLSDVAQFALMTSWAYDIPINCLQCTAFMRICQDVFVFYLSAVHSLLPPPRI